MGRKSWTKSVCDDFNDDFNKKSTKENFVESVDILHEFRKENLVSLDADCLTARTITIIGYLRQSVGCLQVKKYVKIDRVYAVIEMGEYSFLTDIITGSLFYLDGVSRDGKRKVDVSRMVDIDQKDARKWINNAQLRSSLLFTNNSDIIKMNKKALASKCDDKDDDNDE